MYMKSRNWMLAACVLAAAWVVLAPSSTTENFMGIGEPTIFVSIASYRDAECMATIKDIFAKAKRPKNVFVGICEQNTRDAEESCAPENFEYHDNVRKITIPSGEAKGPTYARYLCSTLFRGETYFMQIDSHTSFAQSWDEIAISEQKKCPSPKSILSGYPHDRKNHSINEKSVPILCKSKWNADKLPQFEASIKSSAALQNAEKPFPIPFMSGGFIFAPGSMVVDVPFDPNLPQLFQGEEIAYTARAWTSGYDIYSPVKNIVFHEYYRTDKPKFWDDQKLWVLEQRGSATRVRRILGLEEPAIKPGSEAYSLGTKRTIQEYWDFAGLDPKKQTSTSEQKFC
jgi:hypothetical protein